MITNKNNNPAMHMPLLCPQCGASLHLYEHSALDAEEGFIILFRCANGHGWELEVMPPWDGDREAHLHIREKASTGYFKEVSDDNKTAQRGAETIRHNRQTSS